MQAQLRHVVEGFERAREHLRALAEHDEARWVERPEPGRWSAGECVAHLNLTSEAYLGVVDDGLARAAVRAGARSGCRGLTPRPRGHAAHVV